MGRTLISELNYDVPSTCYLVLSYKNTGYRSWWAAVEQFVRKNISVNLIFDWILTDPNLYNWSCGTIRGSCPERWRVTLSWICLKNLSIFKNKACLIKQLNVYFLKLSSLLTPLLQALAFSRNATSISDFHWHRLDYFANAFKKSFKICCCF